MQNNLEKHVKLFEDVSADDLSGMLSCLGAKTKQYEKNETIMLVEEKVDNVGIVLEGAVLIIKEDFAGNRSIVARPCQYEMFGEAFVCAGIQKSPVTVVASVKSKIMWIKFHRIVNTCSTACRFHSRLIENMIKMLALNNLQMIKKMDITSKRNIRDKLMAYLFMQAEKANSFDFTIPLRRKELADYLYIDRSALSRELCKMRDENIIEFKRNQFSIKRDHIKP